MRSKFTWTTIQSPRGSIYHIRNEDGELIFFSMDPEVVNFILTELNKPRLDGKEFTQIEIRNMASRYVLKKKGL